MGGRLHCRRNSLFDSASQRNEKAETVMTCAYTSGRDVDTAGLLRPLGGVSLYSFLNVVHNTNSIWENERF